MALGGPEHRMTLVWQPDDPALRELRVALAQVGIAAFGYEALPEVRMPLLEGDELVALKVRSDRPFGVLGSTNECIRTFVDDAPTALFDASLCLFPYEKDGERRIGVGLNNVRVGPRDPESVSLSH